MTRFNSVPVIGMIDIGDDTEIRRIFRKAYIDRLDAAGAMVFLIPQVEDQVEKRMQHCVDRCDGILFPGGGDIHPSYFNEDMKEWCQTPNAVRDNMEEILYRKVIQQKKPVLGICRGVQTMNVFEGGSLYQDMWKECPVFFKEHNDSARKEQKIHRVKLKKGSLLNQIYGAESIGVNSMHHQAIKETAGSLITAGRSFDGAIEAIEKKDYPFYIGVQWHPEHLAVNHPEHQKLFLAFVNACKGSSSM